MDIYGVIGWPIKHSLSPFMHNAAFKRLGIPAEYRKFEVRPEELEGVLVNDISVKDTEGNPVRARDIRGFNITLPHKVRAREILEKNFSSVHAKEVLHYVQLSGAINTVRREGDKLFYLNTDYVGFNTSLKEDLGFDAKDKNVLVLGCGGAGRAVVSGLTFRRAAKNIYIYDVNKETLESSERHFSKFSFPNTTLYFISEERVPSVIGKCDLLVNASPVGMNKGDFPVIDKKLLHKGLLVYDVIYNRETELVRDARSLGLVATGGLGMFLYQGVHAFEFWTGKRAPIEVMREALDKALKKK